MSMQFYSNSETLQPRLFVLVISQDITEMVSRSSNPREERACVSSAPYLYEAACRVFKSLPPVDVLASCAEVGNEEPFKAWYPFSDEIGDEGPLLRLQEVPRSIHPSWGHEGGLNLVLVTPTQEREITVRYREGVMESVAFDFSHAPSQFAAGMLIETFLRLIQEHNVDLRTEGEKDTRWGDAVPPIWLAEEAPRHIHLKAFAPEGYVQCSLYAIAVQKETFHKYIHASLCLLPDEEVHIPAQPGLAMTQAYGAQESIRSWLPFIDEKTLDLGTIYRSANNELFHYPGGEELTDEEVRELTQRWQENQVNAGKASYDAEPCNWCGEAVCICSINLPAEFDLPPLEEGESIQDHPYVLSEEEEKQREIRHQERLKRPVRPPRPPRRPQI